MKAWKIAIALFCILFAVFGLLEVAGVMPPVESIVGEVSFWRLVCVFFMVALVINFLCKLKICRMIFSLSLLFMLIEPNIAYLCGVKSGNLINNWLLLFYTLLICVGLWLLLPKHRGSSWTVSSSSSNRIEHSLGAQTIYIDSATFTERYVENNLGSMMIKFENSEAYSGGGLLRVENNLGSIAISVPKNWSWNCQIENNLGSVRHPRGGKENSPSLLITGENNLGSITIC